MRKCLNREYFTANYHLLSKPQKFSPSNVLSYTVSHARMFSRPKILFLVSLLFVALLNPKFNPYLLFKFLIFIILVCLLFIHAKQSNNLLAGAQNVTGAYVIIMLVYRRLLTTRLRGKAAV